MAAAAAIDLAELEAELTRTKRLFEQWSSSVKASAQDCKASHLSKLRASTGEMAALTERYQRAEKQAAQVRQQMAQDTEHEAALQATADSLLAEQQALQKRLRQLQQEVDTDSASVQQLQDEVACARSEYELRMSKLEQLHAIYQDSLGLRLVTREGELCLEFSQVDARDHARVFAFAVLVQGDNSYRVTRCEPEVEGRQQLEAELLGRRGDFAGFVRAMRRRFKQLAEAEAAQAQEQ